MNRLSFSSQNRKSRIGPILMDAVRVANESGDLGNCFSAVLFLFLGSSRYRVELEFDNDRICQKKLALFCAVLYQPRKVPGFFIFTQFVLKQLKKDCYYSHYFFSTNQIRKLYATTCPLEPQPGRPSSSHETSSSWKSSRTARRVTATCPLVSVWSTRAIPFCRTGTAEFWDLLG